MVSYPRWSKPETLLNSNVGYWSDTTHNDEWPVGPVNRRFDNHAEVTKSDHVRSTGWMREAVECMSESPAKWHYQIVHPTSGKIIEDVTSTRWISPGQADLAFWYPPDGYFSMAQNVSDRVSNQARNNLSKGIFDYGTAVGEAVSSAEALALRGGQMAQAIKSFRSFAGSLGPVKGRAAAAFAGAWLEGYYGWGSMARDAVVLAGTLQEKLKQPLLMKTGSKGNDSYTLVYGEQSQSTSEWTHKTQVGYLYKIVDEFVHNANEWGLLNPIATAWELAPLSFVVDWFIPIGNTLSALTATAGLEFVDGYHTDVTECHDRMRLDKPPYLVLDQFDPGLYYRYIYKMNRGKLTEFEAPKLYGNTNPFNTNRITSAIALITQAVFGGK